MANYMCYSRTSYFKVTDAAKLKNLVKSVDAELWEKDGYFAFGQYGSITSYYDEESDELHEIYNELQEILLPDQVAVIYEVGYEKLRYVIGFAVVVTKDSINVISLEQQVKEYIQRDLLAEVPEMWY